MFHATHGFYVHGLLLDPSCFPNGWQERAVSVSGPMTNGNTGWCLEAHDLAAGKLAAYREKDRGFVRTLLVERLINGETLKTRLHALGIDEDFRQRLVEWTDITVNELGD